MSEQDDPSGPDIEHPDDEFAGDEWDDPEHEDEPDGQPDPDVATDPEGDQADISGMGEDPHAPRTYPGLEGGDMGNDPGEDDSGEDVT